MRGCQCFHIGSQLPQLSVEVVLGGIHLVVFLKQTVIFLSEVGQLVLTQLAVNLESGAALAELGFFLLLPF